MAITNQAKLSYAVQSWLDDVLLARKEPNLIHGTWAEKKAMPAKSGDTIIFRRYNNLERATVPLGNSGLTPPSQTLSALDLPARMQWYGSYVTLTDQLTLTLQDPVLNQTASLLAQSLRETQDELIRNVLESAMGVVDCTNGSNGDVPSNLSKADIDAVAFGLIQNDGRFISEMIDGADKFATTPLRPAFWAMASADVLNDLEAVSGFVPQSNYANTGNVLPSEWGITGNVRWQYSTLGSYEENASALGNRVYNVFVTAKNSYACVEQTGATAQFIYQGLGAGNDPLLQRQTAGYKFAEVPKILNESWIKRLRTTLS